MLYRLCLISLLLIPATCLCQKQGRELIDSLRQELPHMQQDTNGVKLLNGIAYNYRLVNPDSGISVAQQELALANELDWQQGQAMAYNDLGNNYLNKSDYPHALEYFLRSLAIDEQRLDKKRVGVVTGNIGMVYWRQRDYRKALEYMGRAVVVAGQVGNKRGEQLALGNMGAVYADSGDAAKALEYGLASLKIAQELDDKSGIIIQSCNIGTEYKDLKDFARALRYQFMSLRIAERTGDRQFTAINLGNIGEIYFAIATDSNVVRADSFIRASHSANLALATEYLSKSLVVSREVDFKQAVSEFSQFLSKAYVLQGNYKAALEAYTDYSEAKDAMFSVESSERIAKLETKRAVELKDRDLHIARLEVLKKRNERWVFIVALGVLLCIMAIIIRSFRGQQRSNALLKKEKKRSDDLLLNILPAEVAEELKEKGVAAAHQFDHVTILFTDFVNFTGTAEKLSPQELVHELHERFTAFDAIIERHGLEKIKTIGDAYMAVCGLPKPRADHAARTVRAALDIRRFIEQRMHAEHIFNIRIGVHSGPVVAGIVGVKKFAYDIWGDTVNTAARMEQHGVAGQVNISEAVYEQVREKFNCVARGRVHAKNKGDIEMYIVENEMPATQT